MENEYKNENPITDLNAIYGSATKAINSCPWKYQNQLFETNQLLYSALLEDEIEKMEYHLTMGSRFTIHERGKIREITGNVMRDKVTMHLMVDEVLSPEMERYLVPTNSSSRKGKGTSYYRKQIVKDLESAYREYGTDAVITIVDFKGFFPSIPQEQCLEMFERLLSGTLDGETYRYTAYLMRECMENFRKELGGGIGVDIGNQFSQIIGTVYPILVDNYVKIVRGVKRYARYTDDIYYITRTREEAVDILDGLSGITKALGLTLNMKKTRVQPISKPFKLLQHTYWLEPSGRIVEKISKEAVTRERRKLKAYKRLLDKGRMTYQQIECAFKGWIASSYKYMSYRQIGNMTRLYYQLFGRIPRWKKHGRLRWLMAQSFKGWDLMGTISSAAVN